MEVKLYAHATVYAELWTNVHTMIIAILGLESLPQ